MAQGQRVANIFVNLQAQTAQFTRGMAKASKSLTGLQKAAIAGTAAVAAGIGKSVKVFADFDDAMQQSRAIMGDLTSKEMADMETAALQVARTTVTSAEEAAESYFFLASAGLDARQSIEALPAVAEFAQAGMFDMATATDLATDAQSALGLKAQDAQENLKNLKRVTDVLVKANTLANATVQQFSESLTNKLGARLRSVNKDIEEGAAALAVLADQGVKGRRAGSGLNIVLRDLQSTAVRNADEFRELGIRVFDSSGEMRNLAGIVADFERAMGDASSEQRAMQAEFLGLNRRAQDFLQLLIGNSGAIAEYERGLRDAGGTAGAVADKQLNTLNKQLGLMRDELVTVFLAIGKGFIPQMNSATGSMRDFTTELADTAEDIRAITARAAAFGSLMANLGETVANVVSIIARSLVSGLAAAFAAVGEAANRGLIRPINAAMKLLGRDFRLALVDTEFLLDFVAQGTRDIASDLQDMGEDFGQVVERFDEAADAVSQARFDVAGEEVRKTGEAAQDSADSLDQLAQSLGSGSSAASNATEETIEFGKGIQFAAEQVREFRQKQLMKLLKEYVEMVDRLDEVQTELVEVTDVSDMLEEQWGGQAEGADRLSRELERAARTGIDFARTLGIIGDSAAATLNSVANLASGVDDLVSAIASGGLSGIIQAGASVLGAVGSVIGGLFGGGDDEEGKRRQQQRARERERLQQMQQDLQITLGLLRQNTDQLQSIANNLARGGILASFRALDDRVTEIMDGARQAAENAARKWFETGRQIGDVPMLPEMPSKLDAFGRAIGEVGLTFLDVQEVAGSLGLQVDELVRVLITGQGETEEAKLQMDALLKAIGLIPDASIAAARAVEQMTAELRKAQQDIERFDIESPAKKIQILAKSILPLAGEGPLAGLLNQLIGADVERDPQRFIDSINQLITAIQAPGQQLEFVEEAAEGDLINNLINLIDLIRNVAAAQEEEAKKAPAPPPSPPTSGFTPPERPEPPEPIEVSRPDHIRRAVVTEAQASELLASDRTRNVRLVQIRDLMETQNAILSVLPTSIRRNVDVALAEDAGLEEAAA